LSRDFFFLVKYIRFLFTSGNAHAIHSPFVFDFYCKVADTKKQYYCFGKIEKIRHQLRKSKDILYVTDYGAGSKLTASNYRSVSSIARHAIKPAGIGQFLFKTVLYFQPEFIFELGTSLGITTLYLAKPNPLARVVTFEGCPQILELAGKNFEKLKTRNIRSIAGNLDETLAKNMDFFSQADMVFFDANHRYTSTMNYFKVCLSKANDMSVFIFDDIHWSDEMESVWEEIKNHPDVTLTIDFFFLGMVFFRKTQPKQHFRLRL
jgi:predicted O-methyltransferase YrrM